MMPSDDANNAIPRGEGSAPSPQPMTDDCRAFREYLLVHRIPDRAFAAAAASDAGPSHEDLRPSRRTAATARRHRSETAATMGGGRMIGHEYEIRELRGGEEGNNGGGRRYERPSLRKSASERLGWNEGTVNNDDWPELAQDNAPRRRNSRPLSLWESQRTTERMVANQPVVGQHRSELANTSNSVEGDALVAEHVALKLRMAELQSEFQLAQNRAQKGTEGMQRAEEAVGQLLEDNARMSTRNAELAEENAFLVTLLGPKERERLRNFREGAGKGMMPATKEKRRHSSYQPVCNSGRAGERKMPQQSKGDGAHEGEAPRRRSSWWRKRSVSMPATTISQSERDAILQDVPPIDAAQPRRWSEMAKSTQSVELELGGDNEPVISKQPLAADEGGNIPMFDDEPLQQEAPEEPPVPEYIQFHNDEDETEDLRCSDISLDVVQNTTRTKRRGEGANERQGIERRMSDIDERVPKYNGTLVGERAHAASGTTRGSEAESYALWRSSGPLAFSVTEHAGVGEGGEAIGVPAGDDESWTPSFAYSSVGAASVDKPANEADAAKAEV